MTMAPEYSVLVAEIDRLEEILGDIEGILKRADKERQRELIGLRRLLSAQMAIVRVAGEGVFSPADSAALATDYRARFSTLARALALHQADWPAVTINDGDSGYLKSANAVARQIHDFVDWTREALAGLR
jgi:hypothetical protein